MPTPENLEILKKLVALRSAGRSPASSGGFYTPEEPDPELAALEAARADFGADFGPFSQPIDVYAKKPEPTRLPAGAYSPEEGFNADVISGLKNLGGNIKSYFTPNQTQQSVSTLPPVIIKRPPPATPQITTHKDILSAPPAPVDVESAAKKAKDIAGEDDGKKYVAKLRDMLESSLGVNPYQTYSDYLKHAPTSGTIAPVLELIDKYTGGKFAESYKAPETEKERMAASAKLAEVEQKRKQDIMESLVKLTNRQSGDPEFKMYLAALLKGQKQERTGGTTVNPPRLVPSDVHAKRQGDEVKAIIDEKGGASAIKNAANNWAMRLPESTDAERAYKQSMRGSSSAREIEFINDAITSGWNGGNNPTPIRSIISSYNKPIPAGK